MLGCRLERNCPKRQVKRLILQKNCKNGENNSGKVYYERKMGKFLRSYLVLYSDLCNRCCCLWLVLGGGIYDIYSKKRQEAIDTPPSQNLIEEHLERELATLDVVLIDTEQDEDVFVAKVWANGGIFRAEYRLAELYFAFSWKLEDVRMIGVGERP